AEPEQIMAALPDQETKVRVYQTPAVIAPTIEPETADITAPADDPLQSLFGDIVAFLESGQPANPANTERSTPANNAPAHTDSPKPAALPEHIEVAAVARASDPVAQPETGAAATDNKGSDPIADIFTFFDEAHKRALEAEKGAEHKKLTTQQGAGKNSAAKTTHQQAADTSVQSSAEQPALFTLLDDIFSSEGTLANVTYAPLPDDIFQNSDRN
ncbi:MAG: hypothetical protein WD624_06635, partial [Rhodospirillales bacterium]